MILLLLEKEFIEESEKREKVFKIKKICIKKKEFWGKKRESF